MSIAIVFILVLKEGQFTKDEEFIAILNKSGLAQAPFDGGDAINAFKDLCSCLGKN